MPHERLREENQQRVLEKAIELCAENGLEQMTLLQVAKEAHVSIRSFYRYYESKDALIKKIAETATPVTTIVYHNNWCYGHTLNLRETAYQMLGNSITE